jgi:CelD/BcsL family acetyltransferase involved in cellulose biosynthesis
MAIDVAVIDSPGAVEPIVAEWDRLAVDAGLPYCAPAWLIAWWRHVAPHGARLRVVAAREGDRLVGVAPFYAAPWRAGLWSWSLLATDLSSRIEPLAEAEAVQEIARTLGAGAPSPARIDLDGVPAGSMWPAALRGAGAGGRPAWHFREPAVPAPVIPLAGGTVDEWLGTRSSNFRQQMRRARRKLEKDGGAFRVAGTAEEIERDLVHFERLHNARWDWRGGSSALPPGALGMLADAGRALGPERFHLVSLEIDGKVVNSQLFLSAGGEISYWNGGFDGEFASYKPSLVGLVEAIRMGLERGCTRFDLGPGAQEYKNRFTDQQDEVVWQSLIPREPRYGLARALYAPTQVRQELGQRLTPAQKQKLKRLLRRPEARA